MHYLYVCSSTEQATSLGTTSVNVYIAIYQLCAISAGILADKIIGNELQKAEAYLYLYTSMVLSQHFVAHVPPLAYEVTCIGRTMHVLYTDDALSLLMGRYIQLAV